MNSDKNHKKSALSLPRRQAGAFYKHKIKFLVFLLVFGYWLFCLPSDLFEAPTSTVVKSREGMLVGARIAKDGQWRFPEMDSVPYKFEQCILSFEDEYFYWHPGFNPVSIAQAFWHNLTSDERRGGSTITQQVVRLSRKNQGRTYWEKLIELFWATRVEAGKSKEDILALYASHAPFGGNVVGLETASWRYFGIPAEQLTWGQAAGLAVLPNAPSLIYPGKNEKLLKEKRDRLLLKLFENQIIDKTTYELAISERLPREPLALPEIAPHFTELTRLEHPGERNLTTLDYYLQQKANRVVKTHYEKLSQNQIHNLAVLILDVETREVLAYVGNSPTTRENDNFVDIVQRPRSTGSILKPFLYAAMLDSGELLPEMLVADVPTTVDGYSPENFDQKYKGAVSANVALSRSLNVPAVRMLREYGLQRFHKRLQEINLSGVDKPANYYGLTLILGGAESSLWDVVNAYAGMASTLNFFNNSSSEYRKGMFKKPIYLKNSKFSSGEKQSIPPVFDAGAIYETFKALREVNRPFGETNWEYFSNSQPIAWKTGTSYGFKDAWAVGVTSKYAIGVWAGNADGEGRPGLTGIQAAAPVLFDILEILPQSNWFEIPHDELVETKICQKSGHLAGLFCEGTKTALIPKDGLKTKACPYCQKVFLSQVENGQSFRVNSSCYPLSQMRQKSWFALPPVMEYYYAQSHPEYRPLPPFVRGCLGPADNMMEFIFPKNNEEIILPKDFDEKHNEVIFKLAHRFPETTVYWYLDEKFMGSTENFHELAFLPNPGKYLLSVVDQKGNELRQKVEIIVTNR